LGKLFKLLYVIGAGGLLQFESETRGGTQARNGWRRHGNNARLFNIGRPFPDFGNHLHHVLALGFALVPVFERAEQSACIRFVGKCHYVEASQSTHCFQCWYFADARHQGLQHFHAAAGGCGFGHFISHKKRPSSSVGMKPVGLFLKSMYNPTNSTTIITST